DWKFPVKDGMLQLRKGNTYDISFYAKTTGYRTKLSVQLGVAPDNEIILWTSNKIEINTELTKYEFTYTHDSETLDDVRFSFIFTDRHSEIILDDIKFSGTRPEYKKSIHLPKN
ncbi:MAG: carbohydrate binding domain-containing protein, partial [Flavobacteriaceae bacterium]|nr:carbohydrate binding domain-containing protein [Flavobacteriaceae bacterium]